MISKFPLDSTRYEACKNFKEKLEMQIFCTPAIQPNLYKEEPTHLLQNDTTQKKSSNLILPKGEGQINSDGVITNEEKDNK
jgi:hypothetical protein